MLLNISEILKSYLNLISDNATSAFLTRSNSLSNTLHNEYSTSYGKTLEINFIPIFSFAILLR